MKIVAEPVDMIAKFPSGAGERYGGGTERPLPCKFRYTDIAGISREIRVDQIISSELTVSGGLRSYIYRCQSIIEDIQKVYELRYVIKDCRWELYKI